MRWGPWISCDGTGWPDAAPRIIGTAYEVQSDGGGLRPENKITPRWPGLFWRWHWEGWLFPRRVRVCDDPAYAPIIRLRWVRPDALEVLRALVADPVATPITAPEVTVPASAGVATTA